MKVAAYTRVSTGRQAEEGSYGLDAQRAAIIDYCTKNGHEIVSWFEDKGISGGEIETRDGIMELISAAKHKPRAFEAVVSPKLNRLARDLAGQLWIERQFKNAKVPITYTEQESLSGTDYMTTAFRQVMGVFAEMEKGMIASRLSSGRKAKAAQGGYAGGRPPIGYKGERGQKNLEVDKERVGTIIRIFELHAQGLSLRQIAVKLNEEGHVTSLGAKWQHKQVGRVIKRRAIYEGQYEYAGVKADGRHEPILKD